jgi:hypothetical protein
MASSLRGNEASSCGEAGDGDNATQHDSEGSKSSVGGLKVCEDRYCSWNASYVQFTSFEKWDNTLKLYRPCDGGSVNASGNSPARDGLVERQGWTKGR